MALLFHCYDEHIWPYFQIFNTLVEKLGLQPLLPWLQIEKSNNQPSCQNKCWQCRLLQTKNAETFLFFIFQLHTQFSIFCFDNTDDTLNGLVRLRHNNHLVGIDKDHVLAYLVLLPHQDGNCPDVPSKISSGFTLCLTSVANICLHLGFKMVWLLNIEGISTKNFNKAKFVSTSHHPSSELTSLAESKPVCLSANLSPRWCWANTFPSTWP